MPDQSVVTQQNIATDLLNGSEEQVKTVEGEELRFNDIISIAEKREDYLAEYSDQVQQFK